MTTNFSGYVLAGGKSSRMGTDKAFLKSGGETFLERAARALSAVCGERIKIVINEKQREKFEKGFPSFDFVFDFFPERGALGGIHAALANCRSDFAIILACDLPFVTEDAIRALAEIAMKSPENIAAVVPRQTGGGMQPLCAAYRVRNCLPEIEKILNNEDSPSAWSVRNFLKNVPTHFVEVDELASGEESESLFFNVNRPSDFELTAKKPGTEK